MRRPLYITAAAFLARVLYDGRFIFFIKHYVSPVRSIGEKRKYRGIMLPKIIKRRTFMKIFRRGTLMDKRSRYVTLIEKKLYGSPDNFAGYVNTRNF
jgi:hypothetical protein